MDSVPGDDGLVEGQARFGTIPVDELMDGMLISALGLR
jgi:hypothetical protein